MKRKLSDVREFLRRTLQVVAYSQIAPLLQHSSHTLKKVDQILEIRTLGEQEDGLDGNFFVPGVTVYLFVIINFLLMLLARLVCVEISAKQPMETRAALGIVPTLDMFVCPSIPP